MKRPRHSHLFNLAQFQFASPFFDLGDKVVERLFKVLGADDDSLDYESFVCLLYMFTKSTRLEKQRRK